MSRETKSGLMLGLSFIVCFAVILSNRGGMSPMDTEAAVQQLLAERNSRPPVRAGSTLSFSAPAVRNMRSIIPGDRGHIRTGDSEFSDRQLANPISPSDQERSGGLRAQEMGHRPNLQTVRSQSQDSGVENGRLLSARALPQAIDDQESWTDRQPFRDGISNGSEQEVDQKVEESDLAEREENIGSRASERESSVEAGTHVVKKGDTLWGIVKQYYGVPTPSKIAEVYDANKDVMPSADTVVVGRKIQLPGIEAAKSGLREVNHGEYSQSRRALTRPKSPSSSQPTFRWYQVAAGDRYVKIAERELGDGNRWRELFEMNKEIFPDPSQIRSGVRIKLPLEGVQ